MNIKKKKMLAVLLIPVILYGILFFTFRKPVVVNNSVDYCEEIADNINKIGLKNIKCTKITEEDCVLFEFYVKNGVRDYDSNITENDILKVRNYLMEYVAEHPDNPLNEKNMVICYPVEMLSYGAYSFTYIDVFN